MSHCIECGTEIKEGASLCGNHWRRYTTPITIKTYTMKREEGYYWVSKMNGLYSGGEVETWFIGYWESATDFWCIGDEVYRDSAFHHINEQRILPPNQ